MEEKHGSIGAERSNLGDVECIRYPVLSFPSKIVALNLDKTPEVSGTLLGIKGQYLILDTGVLNVRKYTGYRLRITS